MFKDSINQIKIALVLLIFFTVLLGMVYPLTTTVAAQLIFPWQANGSLIEVDGKLIGSKLIGQHFDKIEYFWGRPSATTPFPYNAANSSASNLGPASLDLINNVQSRIEHMRKANPDAKKQLTIEMVTASASGLDPDISIDMALYQVPRIARARKIDAKKIEMLIKNLTSSRSWGIFGEKCVNVLQLNLALDQFVAERK